MTAGLIFVITMALAATGPEPRSARPLIVGLLRADCVALPFASYSSKKWERLPFSEPTGSIEEFKGLWFFTSSTGQRSTLSGGAIVTFTGGDTFYEEWGVTTDYQPCYSGMEYPAARIGAVLNEPLVVRPFQQSLGAPGAPESVSPNLRAHFDRLESDALVKKENGEGDGAWMLGHPRDPAIRRQSALEVTELHKSTQGDTTFLYFVARREYAAARPEAPFQPVSVLHGWGLQHKGETILQGLELTLDSGSEMQVSTYTPYGMTLIEGTRYVIAERGGYESTARELLRWMPSGPSAVLPPF